LGEFNLPPTRKASGFARRLLKELVDEWLPSPVFERAEVVIAELVTNAVEHGGSPNTIRFSRINGTSIIIEVSDRNPVAPVQPVEAPEWAENGRGLTIIHACSTVHGSYPLEPGKVMWVVIGPLPSDSEA
jgi:anti-sigma regulatory factor (Ser/Thr protein kinase)